VHPSPAFEWSNYTPTDTPWQYKKKVLICSGQVLVAILLCFPYNTTMQNKTTLITSTGKVLIFTVYACAVLFQEAYGGTILSTNLLENKSSILPIA